MRILSKAVVVRLSWTTGAYGAVQGVRLITSVVLARLLAPEIFGIMLIVNTLRTGVELLSDIGIGQNIVNNKNGEDPRFYNTAWTLQVLRGLILATLCAAASVPIARYYQSDALATILPVVAFFFLFAGFQSVSRFILQKRLDLKRLSIFEVVIAVVSAVAHVAFALYTPTIWALVLGGLFSTASTMIGTYFLIRGIVHRFSWAKDHVRDIVFFGKWVFLSSIVYFLAMNFDRLYVAQSVPLAVLGVFGIARSLSDMLSLLVARIGNLVIFPMVAAAAQTRALLREKMAVSRTKLLIGSALFVSLFVALSDLAIFILYDDRYREASAMVPVLGLGVWFAILCTIAESVMLGLGRPVYGAVGNIVKLVWLVVGLPLAIGTYGLAGAICVIAAADIIRYIPLSWAQRVERIWFGKQDVLITVAMFAMIAVWRFVFWQIGVTGDFGDLWSLLGTLGA